MMNEDVKHRAVHFDVCWQQLPRLKILWAGAGTTKQIY